jgi:GNAT superfamily N-acetyltransferase
MPPKIKISLEYKPKKADKEFLAKSLYESNVKKGMPERTLAWVFLRNTQDKVIGGALFYLFHDFVYIDEIWVDEKHQGKGYGKQMLEQVENEARLKGCKTAHLDTFNFQQAVGFYEHMGYFETSRHEAIGDKHTRYFMKKAL